MNQVPSHYLDRIYALHPDLVIDSIDYNTDGMVNDVLIVNRNLVFRFCKTKEVQKELENELRMLKFLQPSLSVKLPAPKEELPDLVVYPYISGRPLTREVLSNLSAEAQEGLAAELGIFLRELHSVPISAAGWKIPRSPAPTRREDWLALRSKIKEKVFPFLLPYQTNWCNSLFDQALQDTSFFNYDEAIIHGDLACYHILLDETNFSLAAVLDFGTSGMGDPASDIGSLITYYGESFISFIKSQYPRYDYTIQRARFYAQAIELQWVLLGIETGEKIWFTSHIGNARGILE